MTKREIIEAKKRKALRQLMEKEGIKESELVRIAKEFCRCGTCRFFVQHYTKTGEGLDWGHCDKGNIQHSKRVSTASCGFWSGEE